MLANGASLSTICRLLFWAEEDDDGAFIKVIKFCSLLRLFVDAVNW